MRIFNKLRTYRSKFEKKSVENFFGTGEFIVKNYFVCARMGATRSFRSDLLGHSSGTHSAVYTFIVTPPALKKWKKLSKNFLDRFLGPKLRNFVLNITFTRGRFF